MTIQNYCLINTTTNIVDSIIVWDGDTGSWTPPVNYIYIVQATTPAVDWNWDTQLNDWVLTETVGSAKIGFSWNGTVFSTTTSKPAPIPKPPPPVNPVAGTEPTVEGAQNL